MQEEPEFEFETNEAAIFMDKGNLVISFGEGRSASMEIEHDDERELVTRLLGDVNFWHNFIQSLSAAVSTHR